MVRIIILSDTHGASLEKIDNIIRENDYLIHAGDGAGDVNKYKELFGDRLITVKGNNDYLQYPESVETIIGGKKFFITHGHKYSVKRGLNNLIARGYELESDVIIYGHTHIPEIGKEVGMLLINPGSFCSYHPTYCYMIINDGKIYSSIVNIG